MNEEVPHKQGHMHEIVSGGRRLRCSMIVSWIGWKSRLLATRRKVWLVTATYSMPIPRGPVLEKRVWRHHETVIREQQSTGTDGNGL